jgi:hypothetical protein
LPIELNINYDEMMIMNDEMKAAMASFKVLCDTFWKNARQPVL